MAYWRFALRINGIKGILPVLLMSSLLWACGGGGGTGNAGGTVTGVVVDGPVTGAQVNCFLVDSNGNPGMQINVDFATTIDDGSFTLATAVNATDPVICTSTGGTDTVSGNPAVDLSVMIPDGVPNGTTVTANLTPLTTVATQVVQSGGTATALEISNSLTNVATAFGLTGSDLQALVPSNAICDPKDPQYQACTAQNKYQQILDDLSAIAVAESVTMTDLIAALTTDVGTDLVLDGLNGGASIPLGSTDLDQVQEFQSLLDTVIEMKFAADPATSPNGVSMVRNATESSAGVLAIDIKANNITAGSVFGAAFDVDIQNTTTVQWNGSDVMDCLPTLNPPAPPTPSTGCEPGSFLEPEPPVNYLVYLQNTGGVVDFNKLVVGASEQAPATGVTGSGTIITLKFKKTGTLGQFSTLSFSANSLYDSSSPPNAISSTWSAGKITVVF
jgi:hypothetical protein